MEILNILFCFLAVFYIASIVNIGVQVLQAVPIKEEPSTPIYITKELLI